ncbi:MAG: methionine biosynthesis protein MetW [Desulfobulbaceae bacterium]|nr:methionine biosynthesis protein MetW [Desulfobulbaceae bacterium]
MSKESEHLENFRFDLRLIGSWIKPNSKVLDLGCGNGDLLLYLKEHKNVRGTGIEFVEAKVAKCIERGLSVLQGDFNDEVHDYPDNCFDVIILSQTLQQVMDPKNLILELLRIGKQVIVSFPNFSHWMIRMKILVHGRAPKSRQLPYEWYNTPNIRIITIRDFKEFLASLKIKLAKEAAINTDNNDKDGKIVKFLKNIRATYGIMMLESPH